MAAEGYANLHHGGGDCAPYPKTHADVFDCSLKTPNTAGFGSDPSYDFAPNVDKYLYPQPDIEKTQTYPATLECAKGAGFIALSRELHFAAPEYSKFRMSTESRQKDLWRWFLENRENIVPDYCLNVLFIPMCIELNDLYLQICNPVEGLTFDIIEFYTETVLAEGVDAGAEGCFRWTDLPEDMQWNGECNRMIALKLVNVPPANEDACKSGKGLLDGLNMKISAKVFCPWAGE